jgi:inorganic phosphate transporter, PiT family
MPELTGMLLLVVALALLFDFSNGWHDSANAIATVVSTRVVSPFVAVMAAGVLNVAGAFMSTAVAKMVGSGIVNPAFVTQEMVAAALAGAIVWNLFTLVLGLPTSSSHALIGGLVGAAVTHGGWDIVKWSGLRPVMEAMVLAPFFGFAIGFSLMVAISWIFFRVTRSVPIICSNGSSLSPLVSWRSAMAPTMHRKPWGLLRWHYSPRVRSLRMKCQVG